MATALQAAFLGLLLVLLSDGEAEDIQAFLRRNFDGKSAGMVIGLVDGSGSRVFGAGRLDDGSDRELDGDTVFAIGSVTKTFTALLLQDMVERREMKLDDPVARHLPPSVKAPGLNGKEITLLHLATHTSGLPRDADNLLPENAPGGNRFAGYTVEKLHAFLSGHRLARDPGAEFEYSNVGSALLGHAVSLRAGIEFEALVLDRICRPLGMESTRIALTPEMKARLAAGHEKPGERVAGWDIGAFAPAGALHSTARDLMRYVSANLGLAPSRLTPLMEKTHVIRHTSSPGAAGGPPVNVAMAWLDSGVYQPPRMRLLGHAGGVGGYSAFVGFDKMQRRGVVVLSNLAATASNAHGVGLRILQRAPLGGLDVAAVQPLREHTGVGVALALDEKTGRLRITKVLPDTPASRAGLSPGLVLEKIDSVTTSGKSLPECLGLLRGEAGTKVRLELIDPERKESTAVELTRQKFLYSS